MGCVVIVFYGGCCFPFFFLRGQETQERQRERKEELVRDTLEPDTQVGIACHCFRHVWPAKVMPMRNRITTQGAGSAAVPDLLGTEAHMHIFFLKSVAGLCALRPTKQAQPWQTSMLLSAVSRCRAIVHVLLFLKKKKIK